MGQPPSLRGLTNSQASVSHGGVANLTVREFRSVMGIHGYVHRQRLDVPSEVGRLQSTGAGWRGNAGLLQLTLILPVDRLAIAGHRQQARTVHA